MDIHVSNEKWLNKYVVYMQTQMFSDSYSPTSGRAVLRSKLVDGRCRVQFPIALADLAVWNFPWFFPKLA